MTASSMMGKTIAVVDDEPMVRDVLAAYLDRAGFDVLTTDNGRDALRLVEEKSPHLVVLDLMLPEIDGLTVLGEIRRVNTIPVILLTARTDEADRVLGLEMGADDYVVKPFSPREVAARVKAVLKRSVEASTVRGRLEFDSLVIDGLTREVMIGERIVSLTPREFELLHFLASSPRQVFSRVQLLEQVWDSSPDWQDPATVTVHVRRIRRKIEDDPDYPSRLTTVWGVGYRFEP